jgi:uncharacterized protein YecE (DUF72 family)
VHIGTSGRSHAPPGFQLSVKAPRGLTHAKRLYAPEPWLPRLTSAWHELGDERAVLLAHLHPGHQRDDARLDWFLSRLPPWMRVAVEFGIPAGTTRPSSRCWSGTARPTA